MNRCLITNFLGSEKIKTKNLAKKIIIPIVALTLFFITLAGASAVNVTLNPGDPGGVNSAVSTVSSSSDVNNTITLNPGTYNKTTDRNNNITFNNKNLVIQGNGSTGSVIIDAQNSGRLFSITGNSNITFINITFINGNTPGSSLSTGSGGAIYHPGTGTLTVTNSTFNNNTAYNTGGAIYNSGGKLTITNSAFNNNTAILSTTVDTGGGAIFNSNNNLTINNCKFTNNQGNWGGAIYNNANNMNITNSNFSNNNATYVGGGAIYNDQGNNTLITNSNFINNTANTSGGAVYNWYANYLTINESSFTNNSANSGSAISSSGNNLIIVDSNFAKNTATGLGTVTNSGNNSNINNCNFTNNNANSSAGGISNLGNNLTINNTNFLNNIVTNGVAGAIYNFNDNNLTIINSNFTNNRANTNGGAIYNYKGNNTNIVNCNFINNTATTNSGGAIYNLDDVNMNVNNSNFINNSASSDGGAIFNYFNANNTIINNSYFNNNSAYFGGAISNLLGNISIFNSIFTNNVANYGGAILNDEDSLMNITNSSFNNNRAIDVGGGIFNLGVMFVSGNVMANDSAALGNEIFNNGTIGILNLTYLNNSTITVKNNTNVVLYASLTDDMGNPVTGQNISFYVNGTFIDEVEAIEGYANTTFLVNHESGIVPVNGDYTGHEGFSININEGQLLITNETTVIGTINLDKDIYKANETAKGNITVVNTGNNTAINVTTKVNFPPNFVLNPSSVVVSQGTFDPITNIWTIGDLAPGEVATMTFTGKFTTPGEHTISVETSGDNFNTTTDSATALVEEEPEPPIPPEPQPNPQEQEQSNENNEIAAAKMKTTGMPIIAILIVLLSSLGLIYRKK